MIRMDDLKPIIEPLVGDNAAEVIEKLQAIDEQDDRDARIDALTAERDEARAQVEKTAAEKDQFWQAKIKDMFFKPEPKPAPEPEPEPVKKAKSLNEYLYGDDE